MIRDYEKLRRDLREKLTRKVSEALEAGKTDAEDLADFLFPFHDNYLNLIESLENRLRHLLSSETIQLFDERSPERPGCYRRNIGRLDTYGVHHKILEYERAQWCAVSAIGPNEKEAAEEGRLTEREKKQLAEIIEEAEREAAEAREKLLTDAFAKWKADERQRNDRGEEVKA